MIRYLVFRPLLVAAVLFAAPLGAQIVADPLANVRAAEARLDFAAALTALAEAIADRPDDPTAFLARADLHRRMNRPALALADLGTVLARDPANRGALLARAELHLALGALSRARADYETVLAAAPDDVVARVGRARARTRSGLIALALADYDAALALAPDTPGLAEERAALAQPAPTGLRYDAAALMDPAFVVTEGAPGAAARLVIVHAGNDIAREEALLPRAALAPALAAKALGVTHLFTFTGQDSAIWANLALICAGAEGFSPTWKALAGEPARAALEAIDTGRGRGEFEALVSVAYAAAGLEAGRGPDCAFNRGKARAYLAAWSDKREAEAWRGGTIYDAWPVFVFDGMVMSAAEVRSAVAALIPDKTTETAALAMPQEETFAGAEVALAVGAETQTNADSAAVHTVADPEPTADADAEPAASPAPDAAPLPAGFGPVDAAARLAAELRGIWAPSLVDCIAYSKAIADPDRLDTALPGLNPLDGPPIGTVLLTSRRMLLFNAVATGCDLVSVADEAGTLLARLACRNGIAPGIVTPMTLAGLEAAGPAPRLAVRFGAQDRIELLQCRPLGALGRDFAPLWQIDPETCSVSAPVTGARFVFAVETGAMVLTITPDPVPDFAAGGALALALDSTPLKSSGTWQAGAWRGDLGPFAAIADRLATGLLLEVTASGPGEAAAPWQHTLPLLGSGRAMAALAACSGG